MEDVEPLLEDFFAALFVPPDLEPDLDAPDFDALDFVVPADFFAEDLVPFFAPVLDAEPPDFFAAPFADDLVPVDLLEDFFAEDLVVVDFVPPDVFVAIRCLFSFLA